MFRKASLWYWLQAGNNPRLLMLVSAVGGALAYAPFNLTPLLLLLFISGWVVIERHVIHAKRPALRLMGFFYPALFIWNLLTCYWLMLTALEVDSASEAIEAMIAGALAIILNAALMLIPWLVYLRLRQRLRREVALAGFVAAWVAFETLHLRWDLTWSWLNLGHAFTAYPFYIQYIEFMGEQGITFHTLSIAALITHLLFRVAEQETLSLNTFWAQYKIPIISVLTGLALPLVLYPILVNPNRTVFQPQGNIRVRIIQPNIDPYDKFQEGNAESIMHQFVNAIEAPGIDTIDLVVLPETAIPGIVYEHEAHINPYIQLLSHAAQRNKVSIVTGLYTRRFFPPNTQPPIGASVYQDGQFKIYYQNYNAAIVIGSTDTRVYRKSKLVPFVERTPFLNTLNFLEGMEIDIGGGFGSFGLPDSLHNLVAQTRNGSTVAVAPFICYESQFGGEMRALIQKGAQIGVIVTNDGWWGNTSGYRQHAGFTVLRAIEYRRAFARSANTGISLFADAKGTITQRTQWWQPAYIDATLPRLNAQTFYVLYGDWLGLLCVLIAIGAIAASTFYSPNTSGFLVNDAIEP